MSSHPLASHPWLNVALATGLLLPLGGAAQVPGTGRSASASFGVSVTIRPQFRILESKAINGGHEYRVWTNMRTVQLNGQEYRFERAGEATVVVPGALVEVPADPSTLVPAQHGS